MKNPIHSFRNWFVFHFDYDYARRVLTNGNHQDGFWMWILFILWLLWTHSNDYQLFFGIVLIVEYGLEPLEEGMGARVFR